MPVFNPKKVEAHPQYAYSPGDEHQGSLIGKTLLVKGEVISEDEIVIDGKVEGRINVKNRVIIGKNGVVEAEIDAREIVIRGRVNGNIKGTHRVEIVPEGILHGNINSPKVVIADGAVFEGKIDMRSKEGKSTRVADEAVEGIGQKEPLTHKK